MSMLQRLKLKTSLFNGLVGSTADDDQPIWVQGKKFHPSTSSTTPPPPPSPECLPAEHFSPGVRRTLWFSYRRDFPTIEENGQTSDAGWGCMLRTAQMILAHALASHALGGAWRWEASTPPAEQQLREIVALFGDAPQWPFSIHNMARAGRRFGKTGTEWYGPQTAALVVRDLVGVVRPRGLLARVALDGTVFVDSLPLCGASHSPFFLLIPLRLGLDSVNPAYCRSLASLFALPQSVGVVGGKPRSSLYFVASQGSSLYYLDPHTVQPYVTIPPAADHFDMSSWQCPLPLKKMHITDADPSMAAGFLFRDAADFDSFREQVSRVPQDEQLFSVQDRAPHSPSTSACTVACLSDSDDDFEKL